MNDAIVSSVARALLQQLGGVLIGRGLLTAGEADLLVGALLGVVSLVWSILARRRAAQQATAAVQAARAEIPAEVVPVLNQAAEAAQTVKETAATVRDLAGRVGMRVAEAGPR